MLLILKNSVAEVVDYVRLCGVYWFFPALFYCMFTGLLMGILSFKLGSNKSQGVKVIIDFIMCCLVVSSIYMLDRVCGLRNIIPYFGDYTAMFPFFYMGVLCSRHKLVKSVVFQSELMYTFAVILYLCAMLWLGGDRKFSGCFAIIILLQLFIKHEKSIPSILSSLGAYSLEIYAFHWFFLPVLPSFSQELIVLPQAAGISNSNLILLFVMSFLFAVPIIGICIIVTICIRKSRYLNMFVFGSKSEKIKY